MKSYNDLRKQLWRIEELWLNAEDTERNGRRVTRAHDIFYQYQFKMQRALARYNSAGVDCGEIGYWVAAWDRNKDTKVPRSVYAGY